MRAEYPGIYRDRHGEESITIVDDGEMLRMTVRGAEFSGQDFDSMEPVDPIESPLLAPFALWGHCLTSCAIECDISVPVVAGNEVLPRHLHMYLELRPVDAERSPRVNRGHPLLELTVAGGVFSSRPHGYFEDALRDIQAALPSNMYIKACINCAYSDYSPFGQGLSGGLACFRDQKESYRQVKGKHGMFALWDKRTEYVRETALCPEFERRVPGTGYRG